MKAKLTPFQKSMLLGFPNYSFAYGMLVGAITGSRTISDAEFREYITSLVDAIEKVHSK